MHRLRCKDKADGPMFPNVFGRPMALTSLVNRVILPIVNKCAECGMPEAKHTGVTRSTETSAYPNGVVGMRHDVVLEATCTG
jgi:hypothetical protein